MDLLNMLENGDSNLQAKFRAHITLDIFKIIQVKITGLHQPPPPNFESCPTPGGGVGSSFFFAKMKERDKRKGTQSNFTIWLRLFVHRGENCGGGVATPGPLRRTRVERGSE